MELLKSEMTAEEENYQQKIIHEAVELDDEDKSECEDKEAGPAVKAKGKKSKKKNKKILIHKTSESEHGEEFEAEAVVEENPVSEVKPAESYDDDWTSNKKAKKVKTKSKPKAKLQESEVKVEEKPVEPEATQESGDENPAEHRCATCRDSFPSKNKLFAHLKKTNHSIYLGEARPKAAEKPKRKK